MDDLIRRSDAIRLIKRWRDNHEDVEAMEEPIEKAEIQGFNLGLATAEREVANIPAVEPKHGEWSFIGDNMFECTHCGIVYSTKQFDAIRNYTTDPFAPEHCPKCGAKMKGADE